MAHTANADSNAGKREIWKVTIILSVLTLIELFLGFSMIWWFNEEGFTRHFIKGVIIILMLAKAFYIVSYFMHLGHELRNLIMTIVVPLGLFIWFIISFLYEGNSYKNLRNNYDRGFHERTTEKAPATSEHEDEGHETKEESKPAVESEGQGH
jgi:cytochrome c oxidase subunit 4